MVRRSLPMAVWIIAGAHLLAHLLTNGRYGIFRDELYYLACADHLAWGYVDQPPFSIAVLAGSRAILGDAVWAIRIVPALAGVALILAGARLTARLGGKGFAQTLAALAIAVAPGYLANAGFYSMNALDLLFWAGAFWVIDRILEHGVARSSRSTWVLLGLVVGLGLLNKLSVAVLCVGLGVGLVFSPMRRAWQKPGLWIAIAVAALIVLPHVAWQIQNGWPTREFIQNAKQYKIADQSPVSFVGQNALDMLPSSVPIWLAGLIGLLFWRRLAGRRWMGISFLAILVFFILQKSKPYYLYPAFLPLFAAGAAVWEAITEQRRWRWLRPVWIVSLVVGGAFAAPLAIPVLSPEKLIAYQEAIGLVPSNAERSEVAEFSQHLADRFGWRELAAAVHEVYEDLPAEDQARCLIVGGNYGEAAALVYYGRELGLPTATSTHNTFYLWGPGIDDPVVVITAGIPEDDLTETFKDVREVARSDAPYAMPNERHIPIYLCRGLKIPLMEAWQRGKNFI